MNKLLKTILGSLLYMGALGALFYIVSLFVIVPVFGATSTAMVVASVITFLGIGYGGWVFANKVLFKGTSPW